MVSNKKSMRPYGYGDKAMWALKKASQAYTLAKATKALLNVEVKYHDTDWTVSNQTTTATLTQLTNINQGDGGTSRDGIQAKLKSLNFRWHTVVNASATNTEVRTIVFQWNGTTAPVVGDILSQSTSTVSMLQMTGAPGRRFRILYDRMYQVNADGNDSKSGKGFRRFPKGIKCRWSSATGTDIEWGHIYVLTLSSEATNGPKITGYARVRFIDN